MQVGPDGYFHLTYCTNIHPGNGWEVVSEQVRRYGTALKASLAPTRPFGIGLRLSGQESAELLQGDLLTQFRAWLDSAGLYVPALNGFPHGPFHDQPVKAAVHAPDWRTEERVQYTLRLVEILAHLLPAGVDGGISTNPLSYKTWIPASDPTVWETFCRNLVRVVEALVRLRQERGQLIHLDLEPEPNGVLGNNVELVRFFADHFLDFGGRLLGERLGTSADEARSQLLEHVRVCLDTCHMSVSYEEPKRTLERLDEVGIKVGRVQISAALKVALPTDVGQRTKLAAALQQFADPIYLHQVGQRNRDGSLRQYPDLPDALPHLTDSAAAEWNVHFHVPVFLERYGAFTSTQQDIREMLTLVQERRLCQILEIETYTWGVLPPELKTDLLDSIRREFTWVLDVLR